MRSIILISEDRVKTVSNLDNNVFGKWLLPAIREAQDVNLQSIIGSALYNQILTLVDSGDIALEEYELYKDLLDNQIADFLVYQSLVNVIPLINVNMANMGTVVSNDEHIQTLSQGNIDLVRGYYQNLADIYQKRLQDYLKCHCEYFPELNECGCGSCGIKPNLNSNTNTSGIWLGGLRNPQRVRGTSNCCGGSTKSSTDCQEEYNKGYRDGERHQKSLLSSTAFTRNGEYEREDGWNSINVNVKQTGHTDEELEDAYQSGYTSGETHQKSLLEPITITENGTYEREDGYSSILVNVPVEPNLETKYASYDNNGRFVIKPSSGYDGLKEVNLNISVEQTGYTQEDLDAAYQSGYTDGYQSGYTDGWNDATGQTSTGYSNQYLTIEAIGSPRIRFGKQYYNETRPFYYKINDGEWIYKEDWDEFVNLSAGDKLYLKGNNDSYGKGTTVVGGCKIYVINPTAETLFKVYGNIMSLIYGDNFRNKTTFPNNSSGNFVYLFHNENDKSLIDASNLVLPATTLTPYCYKYMFESTGIERAPALPATTLTNYCYYGMFDGCTRLTQAPELPATTLADNCYYSMFNRCTSLTSAPALPATTLTNYCYYGMFDGCTSLTTAPTLPATTLADNCYYSMFQGCSSLTTAPALPATTLANYCYNYMFNGCTSLITAPALPATTLTNYCYYYMFARCTSLTTAPELPATTLANQCYQGMFKGCTGLTKAPSSIGTSATTMATSACTHMFADCTSLTTAPELPATTLENQCYQYMFNGCSNLNYIKCLATDISADTFEAKSTYLWVSGVASTGTFVKDSSMTGWTTGISGIPDNWTVQNNS